VSSNRLVVFSKSADVGAVKTRMRPALKDDECAKLHLALLKDTLAKTKGMDRVLYLSGSGYLPMDPGLPVRKQVGTDLGSRMFHAFQAELAHASKVAIIGADSPTLPAEWIDAAFRRLDQFEAVFGPAEDGGYYLIGLSKLIPEIFESIAWGGPDVLRETLTKIGHHRVTLLQTCFDVDTPADLDRLEQVLPDFPNLINLAEWFRNRRKLKD
jgi:rSAM/selenodomain-associated transferase 1